MTPLQKIRAALERDRELREQATPGPWEVVRTPLTRGPQKGEVRVSGIFHRRGTGASEVVGPRYSMYEGDVWETWLTCKDATADFVAHARNTDLGAALRIAVEALEETRRQAAEGGYGYNFGDLECLAREALAQIAALLPEEGR